MIPRCWFSSEACVQNPDELVGNLQRAGCRMQSAERREVERKAQIDSVASDGTDEPGTSTCQPS